MSDTSTVRKVPTQAKSSGSGHTLMSKRQPFMKEPFASKHVCFYKSGDAQFSGLPVVINKRTFKTFDGLLDSLSKRVPLPFGVRTITTPRGLTAVRSLEQLHNGHSYICSDKRTVKPIDLEQARRKPPPWYHARPISGRRLGSTSESFGPVRRSAPWNEYAAMLHTPKRVVVFRNGAPDVKHTLHLQKRNTPSFKELIHLLSKVMNFPVHKLYTVDGRRVDGLLALILCSGVLVASGRELFKKDNYNIQKPSAPTWLPAKGVERLHHKTRKRKSFTSSTRPFSPSSERYIVNQLHNSYSESAYNYTGSGRRKTEQHVESVETDTMTCEDVTAQESIYMPSNDDIEKSFRVNGDGSMTVEMKVRLTIKNEETVQWTTTLSRSTVASHVKLVSESYTDQGEPLCDNISSDVDSKVLEINQIGPEKHREHSPQAAPLEESSTEQSVVVKESLQPFPSSLGWCRSKQKQISLVSINNKSKTKGQQNVLGLYIDNEETSNEQIKQEYPVPKPRNTMSCKLNTTSSQQQSNIYESAEVLQLQDSGKEAVLHIVKQQTHQKSFLAEESHHSINKYVSSSDQPASFNNVFPACTKIPSSVEDNISTTDGPLHMGQCKETTSQMSNIQTTEKPLLMQSAKLSTTRITSAAGNCRNKKPVRVIVNKSCRSRIALHEHMRKQTKIYIPKEIKKIRADSTLQDNVSQYISSVIEKAVDAHSKECKSLHDSMAHSLVSAKDEIKVESSKQEINVCPISNSDAYQNIMSRRSVLIEQHQEVEKQDVKSTRETKSGVVEQKHKGEQESQRNVDGNKDRVIYNDSVQTPRKRISGKVSVQEDYIVVDKLKYSESSHNEDKLVTSLEEEYYNCDEEYMDFSEALINNKVDNIQISQSIVSGTEQQQSSQNSTNIHKKSLSSLEQSQPYSNRDTLKGSPEIIMEQPDYYMYEEHLGDQKEHEFKEKNTPQTKTYSVTELINNMESFTQQTINKPESQVNKFLIQTVESEPLDTDNLNNISSHSNISHLTSETIPSSLAFSYESLSSSLAQGQERTTHINRVKSIREMFLAKSNTKTAQHRQLHSPNADHSEYIKSGEIWSQRSPETSSGEDDTCRSVIAKGFVRRTIERIYGRDNMNSTMPNNIRPQSASQGKRRKCSGRTNVSELASFHEARARLMSDLAYFSATSSCEVPAHGQVESRDTNPHEKDPCEIEKKNSTILTEPLQKNATDYSHNMILPCNDSLATTISYFNLPNVSDSELEPEEQKSHNTQIEDNVNPEPHMLKSWTEKNRFRPVFTPPVFKKADNKVYPSKEPLTSPVVTQPVSGQSAQTGVVMHSTEPDLLEMLFIFCGRHCPIL